MALSGLDRFQELPETTVVEIAEDVVQNAEIVDENVEDVKCRWRVARCPEPEWTPH